MKIIINSIFPFSKKFYAINMFGVIFSKGPLTDRVRNHEFIHTLQQREMLFIFFYIAYAIEWLIRFAIHRNLITAYSNISFEREAYCNDHNLDYRKSRPRYAWTHYIKNNNPK